MKDLKNNIYLLVFCLIAVMLVFMTIGSLKAQNTLTADNNFNAPTGPNMFLTIQAAVNAASPGDIIQVQPSPIAYGNISIDKPITLMGIGFNVDKDIPLISQMGSIALTNNPGNATEADGTIITGLLFTVLYAGNNTGAAFVLENIVVENCQFTYLYTTNTGYSPIDGLEIRDCRITSSSSGWGMFFYMPTTNVVLRNNLIHYGISFLNSTAGVSGNIVSNNIIYDGIRVDAAATNTLIANNNFIGQTDTESAFDFKLVDCSIENNIFYGSTPSIGVNGSTSTNFQNNTFENNLIYLTGDNTIPPTGGGSGNIDGLGNQVGNPDFVNGQLLNTWLGSYDFILQGGSPAITNGNDGQDIGITGSLTYAWTDQNFVLNTTAVPVIKSFNTSTVINQPDDLSTRIIIQSN